MYQLIGHAASRLARRAPEELPEDLGKQIQALLEQIPAWGSLILIFSFLASVVMIISVVYTLTIVFTLACVEAPQNAIAIPNIQRGGQAPPAYKDTDPLTGEETTQDEDLEVVLVQQKPVTSSIRHTVRHLVSIGGPPARWRGFWFCGVYSLCVFLLAGVLGFLSPFVSGIIARVVLSRWEMAWTHIVISDPSTKPWWRRMPPLKTWRKIWAPTAIAALASQVANLASFALFLVLQMHKVDRLRDDFSVVDVLKVLLVALVYFGFVFLVALPAEVALIRVQCSMLAEGEETVVPVDRTFGERVVSEADGGSGKLSYRDAWKSIDREARKRVIKLIVKMAMIILALYALLVLVFTTEAVLIIVPAFRRSRDGDAPSDDMRFR